MDERGGVVPPFPRSLLERVKPCREKEVSVEHTRYVYTLNFNRRPSFLPHPSRPRVFGCIFFFLPRLVVQMLETVGVVEHGLFLDMSFAVISAGPDGITVKTK